MRKNIYFVLLISTMLIFNVYNVKALEFTCNYKNGSEEVNLYMTYNPTIVSENQFEYSIKYNSQIKKTYPANSIVKYKEEYESVPGTCYADGKYCALACPKQLYIAISSNALLEKYIRHNYVDNVPLAIVFFSENGLKIDEKNGLTQTELQLDILSDNGTFLKKTDFSTKTFTLNQNSSHSSQVETPQESTNKYQYCYYKNNCGKILELKFYKQINIYENLFNDGRKLMNWEKTVCPTSITDENNRLSGRSVSCQGYASIKNCYDYYGAADEKKEGIITDGNCSTVDDDDGVGYTLINGSSSSTIKVSYINSDVASERFKISFNGSVGAITISNASNYSSNFASHDTAQYPLYIIQEQNTKNYLFATSVPKDSKSYNVYILSSKKNSLVNLPLNEIEATCEQLFGGGEGGFMNFLKKNVFKIIYIAVPIILLVLTTIDFSKVVFNDDKDGIKNAWKRFGKRAIAAVLIYLTPTILIFIADVIGANDVNSCIKAIQNMDK
ncbi:MAG: hypothetical protein ACI4WF_02075 [Bacilli bacterium]